MSVWDKLFSFENYGELLTLLHNSILAGALLGLIGGLIGVFVVMRDLTFAVHGISELSFAGAAFALLVGFNVVIGSILGSLSAALLIGFLGVRARERSSFIGVLMPFGLGLGVLFLALYPGRGGHAGDRVRAVGAGAVGDLRGDVGGRRDPAGAGWQPADQPLRHHDLVPDLRGLPDHRQSQAAQGVGPPG